MSRNVQGSPQGGIQGDIKQMVSPNVFVLLFLTGTFNKSPNMNSSETKKFQDIYWQTSLSVFPSGSNLRNISLQVRKVTNKPLFDPFPKYYHRFDKKDECFILYHPTVAVSSPKSTIFFLVCLFGFLFPRLYCCSSFIWTSPYRAWLRLNAFLVLVCLLAWLPACLPACLPA